MSTTAGVCSPARFAEKCKTKIHTREYCDKFCHFCFCHKLVKKPIPRRLQGFHIHTHTHARARAYTTSTPSLSFLYGLVYEHYTRAATHARPHSPARRQYDCSYAVNTRTDDLSAANTSIHTRTVRATRRTVRQ